MSDGACNLRDLQYYMRPNAEHVLDYFHITMRITVLQQMARGLPAVDFHEGRFFVEPLHHMADEDSST